MKKILFSIIICSIFISCDNPVFNNISDYIYEEEFSNIPLYYSDFSEIKNIAQIPLWMKSKISYEKTDEVLSPEEILTRGKCDCDGFAILYMNIAYVRFGIKCSLCIVDQNSKEIIDGGIGNHAIVRLPDGTLIAAQTGRVATYDVGYEYDFDDVFSR